MTRRISNAKQNSTYPVQSVKRFYFLDYFYILLESINRFQKLEEVFTSFLELKIRHRLGESKYKKLTTEPISITDTRIRRYIYTFQQVIDETLEYGLIISKDFESFKYFHNRQ